MIIDACLGRDCKNHFLSLPLPRRGAVISLFHFDRGLYVKITKKVGWLLKYLAFPLVHW